MPKITFDRGDLFKYDGGYGVVIKDGEAVLVSGPGGRAGYVIANSDVPQNAVPIDHYMNYEIRMALVAAIVATSDIGAIIHA